MQKVIPKVDTAVPKKIKELQSLCLFRSTFMKLLKLVLSPILGDPGVDNGGKGKTKRAEKTGAKKSKERPERLFSTLFTFLRASFFRPFSLSLAPTICPWVSEDDCRFEDGRPLENQAFCLKSI